jgi:hypothetical protein
MTKLKSFVNRGVTFFFLIALAGCASSDLVDVWRSSSYVSPPLNKILVVCVSKNTMPRQIWEDVFSVELRNYGVAATSSYRLFPDAVPDTSQVIQMVQSNGFDGILVYRRLPPEKDTQYRQGFGISEHNMVYNHFNGRFGASYFRDVGYAAYVDSQKVDIRAIDVWATKNGGQMIWSATSKTPEPNSIQTVRPEIVKMVLSDLIQHGIIVPEK